MTQHWLKVTGAISLLAALNLALSGCASIAEGVTRALTDQEEKQDRLCELHGPAFTGMAHLLDSSRSESDDYTGTSIHKVLMIHGIGGAKPGYSVRLQKNLITVLDLTRISNVVKRINLRSPDYQKESLGTLQVTRFQNRNKDSELHFYELTWSAITQKEKDFLAASDSGLYAAQRAEVNSELKVFVNNHVVDPALYTGMKKNMIIESASQAICWMLHHDWNALPELSTAECSRENIDDMFNLLKKNTNQDFSFITHSLGSRIAMDTLDSEVGRIALAQKSGKSESIKKIHELIKNYEFRIYMMSNQLPLLQLGRPPATVTGRYEEYCKPSGRHYNERFLDKLFIVAFSDPNDLLSYNIPHDFASKYIDSRLCPEVVNVSVSVTDPIDLFGAGKLANPLSAHTEYLNDDRVMGIIGYGIGQEDTYPSVASSCKWLEIIEE